MAILGPGTSLCTRQSRTVRTRFVTCCGNQVCLGRRGIAATNHEESNERLLAMKQAPPGDRRFTDSIEGSVCPSLLGSLRSRRSFCLGKINNHPALCRRPPSTSYDNRCARDGPTIGLGFTIRRSRRSRASVKSEGRHPPQEATRPHAVLPFFSVIHRC